ncbi:NAD(+)/NADH kinase [Myxococcota bacterium]|nr:NAD(+)/NADH kinase [Myxococcota bacterium]
MERTSAARCSSDVKRACLVFNPSAGTGDPDRDERTIRALLDPRHDLFFTRTSKERDAEQCARDALDGGAELVIASGGDGTISKVAGVLVDTGIPLAIVPRGTASSIAAALGVPADLEGACVNTWTGAPYLVDTAHLVSSAGEHTSVLMVAVGFHAEAVAGASREAKDRWGIAAYVATGLAKLGALEPFTVRLETDRATIRAELTSVTVANCAPPQSVLAQGPSVVSPVDGLLDLTLLASKGLDVVAAGLHLLRTAQKGEPATRGDVGYLVARAVTISTPDAPRMVLVDGDDAGTTPVTIECRPKSLAILLPAPPPEKQGPEQKLEGLPNLDVEPR